MSNHPDGHKNFEEKLKRAQDFNNYLKTKTNKNLSQYIYIDYIDYIDCTFENLFQSWPDKFFKLKDLIVIEKSEYNFDGILINDWI